MIFAVDSLKFDTDNMEKITDEFWYLFKNCDTTKCAHLYKSKKGRYVAVYSSAWLNIQEIVSEADVKRILMHDDLATYEKLFGELEEG